MPHDCISHTRRPIPFKALDHRGGAPFVCRLFRESVSMRSPYVSVPRHRARDRTSLHHCSLTVVFSFCAYAGRLLRCSRVQLAENVGAVRFHVSFPTAFFYAYVACRYPCIHALISSPDGASFNFFPRRPFVLTAFSCGIKSVRATYLLSFSGFGEYSPS